MTMIWKDKKAAYRFGYYIRVLHLYEEYYEWERDPMCDSYGLPKRYDPTDEWRIEVSKVYHPVDYGCVDVTFNPFASTGSISKDEAVKIWMNLTTKFIPRKTIIEYFEALK